jgi:hypothetical protein
MVSFEHWYELATKLNGVTLDEGANIVQWKWCANKKFSVKSVYEHLTKEDRGSNFKKV